MPEDLIKFGLIPEFIGRLPVVASVTSLDKEALVKILTEPRNALVKQYCKLFEMDGVELEFTDDALEAVADQAILRGTGARGLRAIMEEVLLPVMYDIPSRDDVAKVVVTEQTVREQRQPDDRAAHPGPPGAARALGLIPRTRPTGLLTLGRRRRSAVRRTSACPVGDAPGCSGHRPRRTVTVPGMSSRGVAGGSDGRRVPATGADRRSARDGAGG